MQRVLILLTLGGLTAAFFASDLQHGITFTYLKSSRHTFSRFYAAHRLPPIMGIDQVPYLTSDNLLELPRLERLVVLGCGPIGCEPAQAFARFGSNVIQMEMTDRLPGRKDEEVSALVRGQSCEVTRFPFRTLDGVSAEGEEHGFVKVLTKPGSDKILGVTIVSSHAGDLIAEYIGAMKNDIGLNKILRTIHIYPTLAETNKAAAGEWKKAHAAAGLLRWIKKYHTWRRG